MISVQKDSTLKASSPPQELAEAFHLLGKSTLHITSITHCTLHIHQWQLQINVQHCQSLINSTTVYNCGSKDIMWHCIFGYMKPLFKISRWASEPSLSSSSLCVLMQILKTCPRNPGSLTHHHSCDSHSVCLMSIDDTISEGTRQSS